MARFGLNPKHYFDRFLVTDSNRAAYTATLLLPPIDQEWPAHWLIDVAEKRETFNQQVSGTVFRLHVVMENILTFPDAPKVRNRGVTAADLLAIIRGFVDAAGERGEGESDGLMQRTEGAVWGYLRS